MTPRRIGHMFTSYEMAEWHAYEVAYGPIGGHWANETLAQMHELLQQIAYLGGAQAEENPIPQPTTKDRPGLVYGFDRDERGLFTVVPAEAQEAIQAEEEEQSDGGFEALDAYLDGLDGPD